MSLLQKCHCKRTHDKIRNLFFFANKNNLKIPKWQKELVKSEDRQIHGQQSEMKDKHSTNNTTLKTKAGVTRNLQKLHALCDVSSGASER